MRFFSRIALAALVGTGTLAGGCALVLGDFKLPADGAGGSGGGGSTGSAGETTTTGGGCGADETACGTSCVKTASDPANCGKCGNACAGAEVCTGATCVACPAGGTPCNGVCVDVQTDPTHCGTCAVACDAVPDAVPHCAMAKCTLMCSPGFDACKGGCVQLDGGACM